MDLPRAIVPPDAVACDGTATTSALRLDGDLRLDGAWVLDRYLDPITGVSAIGELLDRSWGRPMGLATATLGVRMAELLATRRWPDDLVVVAVPSERESAGVLARVVGHVLEREVHPALVSRRWLAGASSTRRFAVRSRHMSDHVLLVDDVVRTGDTLAVCAELLRARGAVGVWAVAAAVEPVQGSHRVVPVRLHVATGRRSTAIRADLSSLVPVTFDGRLLVTSPEDESHEDTAGTTPPSPLILPGPEVTLQDRELDDEELVDRELMDAVALAFEAVAGLEALRSIVSQHSGDEALSIDDLLSDLLRSTTHSGGVDHVLAQSDRRSDRNEGAWWAADAPTATSDRLQGRCRDDVFDDRGKGLGIELSRQVAEPSIEHVLMHDVDTVEPRCDPGLGADEHHHRRDDHNDTARPAQEL